MYHLYRLPTHLYAYLNVQLLSHYLKEVNNPSDIFSLFLPMDPLGLISQYTNRNADLKRSSVINTSLDNSELGDTEPETTKWKPTTGPEMKVFFEVLLLMRECKLLWTSDY